MNKEILYRELNENSNQLSHLLFNNGLREQDRVAILLDRSPKMIQALLGILKAGGCYVPIDVKWPKERVIKLIISYNISIIITQYYLFKSFQSELENLNRKCELYFLDIEEQFPINDETINKELNGEHGPLGQSLNSKKICLKYFTNWTINQMSKENLNLKISSDNIAYIITTSGTTGVPNGVAVIHKSVLNLIDWVNDNYGVCQEDKLLFVTSICFDLSVYDIFGILASGGSIQIATNDDINNPKQLLNYLFENDITFWNSAPAVIQQLVDYFPTEVMENKLRLVFLSGDWIPIALPNQLRKVFKKTKVISLGGPTETTVWSNYYPVENIENNWISIPYGKPIQNVTCYILDERLRRCPVNVSGELYVGGICLSVGYVNNEQLTNERFIRNPFSDDPTERIYKTGDIAKWNGDGNMILLGRKDDQVKIRGYRIELGEIEAVIGRLKGITWSKVLVKQDNSLNLFYKSEIEVDNSFIREYLERELPFYMVPQTIIQQTEIPLTINGKLDREKLIANIEAEAKAIIPAQNEIQQELVSIWASVLEIDKRKISIHDNFFSIGGHSLKAMRLSLLIFKKFEVKIKQIIIFSNPTISLLSKVIETEMNKPKENDEIIL